MDDDVLRRIEAQRSELESQVAKLRKSLRHWQTIEIDYEGLKEEILIHKEANHERRLQAAQSFQAELVDDKELDSILMTNHGQHRTPAQVVDLLTKRVEYVTRNVETVRKQLAEVEKKRNVLLLAEKEEYRDEAGLPLTEITEELDEEGNVVSSRVQRPGEGAAGLVDVLKQVGVTDIMDDGTVVKAVEDGTEDDPIEKTEHLKTQKDSGGEESNEDGKGHIGKDFLKKTATAENGSPVSSTTKIGKASSEHGKIAEKDSILQAPAKGNQLDKDDSSSFVSSNPDDDEDEALLRHDMLEYQRQPLDEIGAIVAELDLAEDASDVSYDPEDENLNVDSDANSDMDEDNSEDETGKSKRPILSASYKQKMEELEKKLNIKAMENLGPAPAELPHEIREQLDRVSAREAARKATLARHEGAAGKEQAEEVGKPSFTSEIIEKKADTAKMDKKKVTFSDTLDIAQEPMTTPQSPSQSNQKTTSSDKIINPMSSTIVERSTSTPQPPTVTPPQLPQKKERISRFKSSLQKPSAQPEPPTTHKIPQGIDRLVASTLVERTPPSSKRPPAAPELDDVDEEIHKRQIAEQFQKLRNRRIHAQGGFVEEDEDEEEFRDGAGRKISRFKSARMKP